MADDPVPPMAAAERHPEPPRTLRRSRKRLLVELVIVTTGVLIALLLEGLVDWNRYRVLVQEARATITREVEENKLEVEAVLATLENRKRRLAAAQRFADQLIADKTTDVSELNLGFEFAELTAAAWHGAQQTGALGHMDYGEVREYTQLYELQELYAEQQRRSLATLAAAMAFFGANANPNTAAVEDLRMFRQHLLTLRGAVTIEEQLAKRLLKGYEEFLGR